MNAQPCPDDGTYGAELDGLSDKELDGRLAELSQFGPYGGHPCGLEAWGLPQGPDGQLRAMKLHDTQPMRCAEGYATDGLDVEAIPPTTELVVRCTLNEHGEATAYQGQMVKGAFVEKPDITCDPIVCRTPTKIYDHANVDISQRAKSPACQSSDGEFYVSHGCDAAVTCHDGFSFPALTATGQHEAPPVRDWVARCLADTRTVDPGHGCEKIQCVGLDTALTKHDGARQLKGEDATMVMDLNEEFTIDCPEGHTVDGRPYSEHTGEEIHGYSNRMFVLKCQSHEDHQHEHMQTPHLECVNCNNEIALSEHLHEGECQVITCPVPEEAANMERFIGRADEVEGRTPFGDETTVAVPYGTPVELRCDVGYQLFKDGAAVAGGDEYEWIPVGVCEATGSLTHEAKYTCVKKPRFCPDLWAEPVGADEWQGAWEKWVEENQ